MRFIVLVFGAFSTFFLMAHALLAAELISPQQALDDVKAGKTVLIDIRTPPEWKETGIAEPAETADMTSRNFIANLKKIIHENPDKKLAFICHTGNRSSYLVKALEGYGLNNLVDVDGGMAGNTHKGGKEIGWIKRGLPVKRM